MNYRTSDKCIIESMENIFGKHSNSGIVNFAVDYSQGRKITTVSVQLERFPLFHNLIFIYDPTFHLYDVIKYKNHTVYRMGQLTQVTPQIEVINKFILKNIPHIDPQSSRQLNEESEMKDSQLDIMKSENKMLKDKIRSYIEQIKFLRDKITLLNKRLRLSKNR